MQKAPVGTLFNALKWIENNVKIFDSFVCIFICNRVFEHFSSYAVKYVFIENNHTEPGWRVVLSLQHCYVFLDQKLLEPHGIGRGDVIMVKQLRVVPPQLSPLLKH